MREWEVGWKWERKVNGEMGKESEWGKWGVKRNVKSETEGMNGE